ncbi:disulfide bond formation protein B [Actibacterium sp. MT2.3-13A]|uniref:disulfide bond formation protein B n=1 Tax=Actibacterium sp. MT2.3-13A TaxID=2828332 RepID=UPI00201282D9|nr:disulfide bond formation protein B [Actibacterium sp. MT2.3-13A]
MLILLAAGGSLALLLGAFGFQYLGGLAPCKLCLWQRWPHGAAIAIGALALVLRGPALPVFGALAALTTAGIGTYHTGVERKWWAGPSSCTGDGGALSGLSGGDLLNFDAQTTIIMCDVVPWEMFGLSMASYNALASVLFAALWLMAARAR